MPVHEVPGRRLRFRFGLAITILAALGYKSAEPLAGNKILFDGGAAEKWADFQLCYGRGL